MHEFLKLPLELFLASVIVVVDQQREDEQPEHREYDHLEQQCHLVEHRSPLEEMEWTELLGLVVQDSGHRRGVVEVSVVI